MIYIDRGNHFVLNAGNLQGAFALGMDEQSVGERFVKVDVPGGFKLGHA